ncbi:MAG: hypothetical protein GQF41_2529 [Candidatus Rifleibacterium amylolyticum]|nr:MAG: hypothetical protein GQF41_2529 [Candidatus Rifleibacterium amylolyticum]
MPAEGNLTCPAGISKKISTQPAGNILSYRQIDFAEAGSTKSCLKCIKAALNQFKDKTAR